MIRDDGLSLLMIRTSTFDCMQLHNSWTDEAARGLVHGALLDTELPLPETAKQFAVGCDCVQCSPNFM